MPLPMSRDPQFLAHFGAGAWGAGLSLCRSPVGEIWLKEALAAGGGDGFEAAVCAQLAEDVLDVVADGLGADEEALGDVDGLGALFEKADDLDLPPSEGGRSGAGGSGGEGIPRIWREELAPQATRRTRALSRLGDGLEDVENREAFAVPVGSDKGQQRHPRANATGGSYVQVEVPDGLVTPGHGREGAALATEAVAEDIRATEDFVAAPASELGLFLAEEAGRRRVAGDDGRTLVDREGGIAGARHQGSSFRQVAHDASPDEGRGVA